LKVLPYRKRLIKQGILKNHAKLSCYLVKALFHTFSADCNLAAVFFKLAADYRNGGGFSGTVNPQKGKKLSLFHRKGQIVYRLHLTEGFIKMFDFYNFFILHFINAFQKGCCFYSSLSLP
jgi:carotenoid cleavage dioxygenase-like enzyme